jgi:maltoporin
MAFHYTLRHTNTECVTEGRWHQVSITARPYNDKKVKMCRYVSVLRRRSGVNSGALNSSYFTQSTKSSIWRLIGGQWLDGAHRSEQKYWTIWLNGCQLTDTLTDCLISGRPTDCLVWHPHVRTYSETGWLQTDHKHQADSPQCDKIFWATRRQGWENDKLIWLN